MAGEWKAVPVQDIAKRTATGPFGSAISSKHFVDSGVPVIRGSNLSQIVSTRLDDSGLVFVSEEKAQEFGRSEARRGDLIFTCWGSIDQVGLIDSRAKYDHYIVSNKQMLLTPEESKADSLFLYYYFASPETRAQIINEGIGSSVPGFNLGQLRSFKVLLPTLAEQKAIAAMLGALDDKIELNQRMNATLEAMARALFQSWFVDFDPVQAKLDGRQPVGLDPATAALFPDSFHETKVGHIPAGWELGRLADLCNLKRGHDLPTTTRTAGLIPVISSSGTSGTHSETNVRGPGVVTGRYGTIGKVFYVETDYWPLNTTLFVDDFKGNSPRFIFHVLGAVNFQNYTDKAAVPGVNRNHLHEEPTILPPMELRQAFAHTVSPLWLQHAANERESRTLATLRDTLLPKLLSGELKTEGFIV